MNIETFYSLLKNHDWYYGFSDDNSVWARGERKQRDLIYLSKESEQHRKLYADYVAAVNRNIRGEGWDPPECPDVVNITEQPETNKRKKAAEGKKMDTSSNVNVKLTNLKAGLYLVFKIYRLVGTKNYEQYWLKVQRGIPPAFINRFPNHEALADTFFLSIWDGNPDEGGKKVSNEQISGSLETIGLLSRLIMKKGVAEGTVNPNNPTGKAPKPAEAYNF